MADHENGLPSWNDTATRDAIVKFVASVTREDGATRPALRLLLLHNDASCELDYVAEAERALDRAKTQDWTVVSLKDDWATVF